MLKSNCVQVVRFKNKYKIKLFIKQREFEVLQFEKLNKHLSEQEMVNLFIGFVRLIKKSITEEVEIKYKKQLIVYENKIKNLLNGLN